MVARLRVISKSQSMIFLISNIERNGKISREQNYFEKNFFRSTLLNTWPITITITTGFLVYVTY